MIRYAGLFFIALVYAAYLIWGAPGDDKYSSSSQYGIPAPLQPSLDQRLGMFIAAQANQRWEDVAALLGRYRMGGRRRVYTAEHKNCLLQQIQSTPLVSFTVDSTLYSSELNTTPPGQRWWYLHGQAQFKKSSGIISQAATVVAYLDQGEWYFTPPNYDREWEESHVTAADRIADYASEVQVDLHPECPLRIRDMQVHLDQRFLSLRVMTYGLFNNSKKKVMGYGLELAQCGGSVSAGLPTAIDPGTVSAQEKPLTFSAYVFWCEGISLHRFVIDYVHFEDGSYWHDPRYQAGSYRQECEHQ